MIKSPARAIQGGEEVVGHKHMWKFMEEWTEECPICKVEMKKGTATVIAMDCALSSHKGRQRYARWLCHCGREKVVEVKG